MKKLYRLALFTLISLPAFGQIDLHSHLIMKPGLGLLLRGTADESPRSDGPSSRHQTKATFLSFDERSTLGALSPLIVVSLYGHPILSATEVKTDGVFEGKRRVDEALEKEYKALLEFVGIRSAQFGIAKNSNEAAQIIAQKKTAIVLSIEGAYGALETEEGFKKWIDDRGVAIVTPFHLTKDEFSGVALLEGIRGLNSPMEFLNSLFLTGFSCLKTMCKGTVGISPRGDELIQKLIARKVWVDTAHSNEMDLRELLPILEKNAQPLLVTHTQLRSYYPAERGLSEMETDYLKKNDGIIGLIPSSDMISNSEKCGLDRFKETVAEASKKFGAEKVVFGSDINAPLSGLSSSCAQATVPANLARGFYTYSQWPELYQFTVPIGETAESWNKKSLTHFLAMWKKIR